MLHGDNNPLTAKHDVAGNNMTDDCPTLTHQPQTERDCD
jgi:hypothetical protein